LPAESDRVNRLRQRIGASWPWALAIILLIALLLRLQHIHDPLLDHPNWRQGDTASIARNFAQLRYDILFPQTDYDGPPPNYVELELQILPFLAATLYKVFGVHEIFGRLLAIAFSLGTVALTAFFARLLYNSALAGLAAAAFFAVFPGSVYYGRTFTPDVVMAFFLTAALYACFTLVAAPSITRMLGAGVLLTLAYLAKPVAVLAVLPLLGMMWEYLRQRPDRRMWRSAFVLFLVLIVPLAVLWAYDRAVDAHAEWHWTSGITTLHVLPALSNSFVSFHAFRHKVGLFFGTLGLLRVTMLGSIAFALTVIACVAIPWTRARSPALLWCWLVAGLLYAFVVVTVERVDYYLLPLLPFSALVLGGAAAALSQSFRNWLAPAVATLCAIAVLFEGRSAVGHYYHFDRVAYADAVATSHRLPKNALVVMGHYGPDVLYYIDRFGWEEDPELWTPFDEESAIRKGARYYISVEDNRLRKNADLCAWLQRFPVIMIRTWRVYETDPRLVSRNAEPFWDAFRLADRAGRGRQFLDARRVCLRGSAKSTAAAAANPRRTAE
jgi:4-amino-4-deoxy-L-arabinose transferase-like glycosyltransferase